MSKEDMMNKISFALKDPILQMGFEVICKENAELEKENAELKSKNCWKTCKYAEPKSQWISQHIQDVEQLTNAKELIKELSSSLSVVGECEEEECELLNRAEQFLRKSE